MHAASAWVDLVRWPGKVWLLGVGGLFGYHALYFAALQLAPPAEANLVNYLWPLLIVLLSAPLAGERLGWPHLVGALLGFAGVALLAVGRGVSFAGTMPWAMRWRWAAPSPGRSTPCCPAASARLRPTPSPPSAPPPRSCRSPATCCSSATVWPATPMAWLSVLALGIGPTGGAFYLWDHAVKRGDIRALGALSYAAPILSTALLVLCGLAPPTVTLLIAALLVTAGAVLASREMWKR